MNKATVWASVQVAYEPSEAHPGTPTTDAWVRAKLLFGRPLKALDCVVIHITRRRARIIAWPGIDLPDHLHLLMPDEATAYAADVVGSAGYQFDLRLTDEIPIDGTPWRVARPG